MHNNKEMKEVEGCSDGGTGVVQSMFYLGLGEAGHARLSIPPAAKVPTDYTTTLVIATTSCFGFWVPEDTSCVHCDLLKHCTQHVAMKISKMGETLEEEHRKEERKRNFEVLIEQGEYKEALASLEDSSCPALKGREIHVKHTPVETLCFGCDEIILADTKVVWSLGLGACHPKCAQATSDDQ